MYALKLPNILLILLFSVSSAYAFPYPPEIDGAKEFVYKKTPQGDLKLWVFSPEGHCDSKTAPAVVFFFGGGWKSGSPAQFIKQCEYLASRGMVAITADYRVLSRHQTKADSCVKDGKSAVRWIRENADRLGVDPNRIAAGGGSAGGHVAAAVGIIDGFEECGENLEISSKPDTLLLFNPAVTLMSIPGKYEFPPLKEAGLSIRIGVEPMLVSPYHHIRAGLPPTIIFHGTKDSAVDYQTVVLFEKQMKKLDNHCQLVSFPDQPHGFFNYGRFQNKNFRKTMESADQFLIELGWLKGSPTIEEFLSQN